LSDVLHRALLGGEERAVLAGVRDLQRLSGHAIEARRVAAGARSRPRRRRERVAFSPDGTSLLVAAASPVNQILRFDVTATP